MAKSTLFERLFRKKTIAQIQQDLDGGEHGSLLKTLTLLDLTCFGIAAVIGAGIFSTIGTASFDGGPAISILFVITGFACLFSALCYAEFASTIPVSGSAYTYSFTAFGELIAWLIGWNLLMEYSIGNSVLAFAWSEYFMNLVDGMQSWLAGYGMNFKIPEWLYHDHFSCSRAPAEMAKILREGGVPSESLKKLVEVWEGAPQFLGTRFLIDVPALMINFIITTLVILGIQESKMVSNAMVFLKLGVILLVVVVGVNYVQPKNWSPFAPNGLEGVFKGIAAVFFAYIGFDALSTTAEECKNPQRDLPRAMIYSLIICTVLYCLLALILTGMVPYTKLNVGDPLAFVFGAEGANIGWVAGVIAISAVIALATVFLVFQIGQPRLWMAISRDGLLPKRFAALHPKFKTPSFSTIITGLVVAIPALFMNLTEVTDLASIGTLFAFAIVCAGVLFKDKEFGKENRYVPYIDGSLLLPILLLALTGVIWFFNPDFVKDLVTITPQEGETFSRALSHKIPIFVFIGLTIVVTFFTIAKRLTLIPVLGLLLCSYLMTELGITNWLRFAVWLLIGLAVYFGYSVTHSNLAGQGSAKRTTSLYLRMASVGFLAAALGLAVSAFTFVADFVTYLLPGISVDTIYLFELGFSVFGLVFGAVGVIFEKTNSTAVTNR